MKIGTILLSHVAGKNNPHRYFIYTGIVGDYATGIVTYKGKLDKIKYYKKNFKEWVASGDFEAVGYSEGFSILREDLERQERLEKCRIPKKIF